MCSLGSIEHMRKGVFSMIARCAGHDCPLKKTCYRWLMPDTVDKSAWTQSMYSPMHNNCRNFWPSKIEEDTTLDDHARMLNAMIKRMNLMDKMKDKPNS